MNNVSIKTEFELDEVLKDIGSNTITKEVLVSIIEKMNPKDYFLLDRNYLLWNFTKNGGVLDDETIKVLLNGNITTNQVVYSLKLSPEMIDYILSNCLYEIVAFDIIEYQTLSTEQFDIVFDIVLSSDFDIYASDLGEVIGNSGNIELTKHVIMNLDNYNLLGNSIESFREELFYGFGSVIIDPPDELIIFGFNRPMLCAQDVLDLKPCKSGWKRVLKWASLDGKKYSWNEIITLHIDANQDKIINAKSDLLWLANEVRLTSLWM